MWLLIVLNNEKLILIIACLVQFIASFVGSMMVVAIPKIAVDMNLSVGLTNWITLIFLIATMALPVPLAKYVRSYGIRKYTISGIVILVLGIVLSLFAQEISLLIFSRVVQGIGVSILAVTIHMMVVQAIPEERVGRALGMVGSFGYIGLTTAPAITGFIIHLFSWRYIFIAVLPVAVLTLILLLSVKIDESKESITADNIGVFLYIISMVTLVYGLNNIETNGVYAIIVSIASFVIYMKYELGRSNQLYNLELVKNSEYVIGNIAAMISYFVTFLASNFIITFYLSFVLNVDSVYIGLLLLVTPIVMVICSPISGRLSDRHDSRVLASIALVILAVTLIILYFVDILPFYALIVALVLQGIGHAIFSAPNNKTVLTSIETEDLADAAAMLTTFKELGKSISVATYTVVFSLIAGANTPMGKDIGFIIATNRYLILISLVLMVIGMSLLVYSKLNYEEKINMDLLKLLKVVSNLFADY